MIVQMQFRRGTGAEWTTANPILGAGEPGYDETSGNFKIGDGVTRWADLGYQTSDLDVSIAVAAGEQAASAAAAAALAASAAASAAGVAGTIGDTNDTLIAGRVADTASVTRVGLDKVYGFMVSVKDPRFGATGDGTTDDTTAIQNAINAVYASGAGGGTVYFPKGTYVITAGVTGASGVNLQGAGMRLSVLKTKSSSTATKLIDYSFRPGARVSDLGFDGVSHATTRSGIYAAASGADKHLVIERCRFVNFMPSNTDSTNGAIYTWNTSNVRVTDCEFEGCGRAVVLDNPTGDSVVHGNRMIGSGAMATGVFVKGPGTAATSKVSITTNFIDGATYDTSGVGTEGHGISCYQSRDVKIIGNTCTNSGRGILISSGSYGAIVTGNICYGNIDAGIRTEPNISDGSTTVGTAGAVRGLVISGNVCRNNGPATPGASYSGIGITVSYAAASVVTGNICHSNKADGIACDSDRVIIQGNTVHSNWQDTTNSPPTGAKAGIRVYASSGCIIQGNVAFDNQTTKTQAYGLSLNSSGHIVGINSFAGNGTAEIDTVTYARVGFYGATPVAKAASPGTATGTDAAVINAISTALRNLGLIT